MSLSFLDKVKTIAVVGASRDKEKWGYKVFKTLLEYSDVNIYPVNPKADTINGFKVYPSIKKLPEVPDLVVTVVPPEITQEIVEQAKDLDIERIWFQPGSESDKAIEMAEDADMKVYSNFCMVESSQEGTLAPPK